MTLMVALFENRYYFFCSTHYSKLYPKRSSDSYLIGIISFPHELSIFP